MKAMPRLRNAMLSAALVLAGAATAGCDGTLLAGHLLSGAAGWLIGRATTPVEVETRCFRDGEPVDCSELPT